MSVPGERSVDRAGPDHAAIVPGFALNGKQTPAAGTTANLLAARAGAAQEKGNTHGVLPFDSFAN